MLPTLRIETFRRDQHADRLSTIDTSFGFDRIYALNRVGHVPTLAIETVERSEKKFPLYLEEDDWDHAWLGFINDAPVAFIATSIARWNKRLVINQFFVDSKSRRLGIGRRMLNHAIEVGRINGANTAWAETSNLNFDGIEIYKRLGFNICGFDSSLYRGTKTDKEFAVFLSRDL